MRGHNRALSALLALGSGVVYATLFCKAGAIVPPIVPARIYMLVASAIPFPLTVFLTARAEIPPRVIAILVLVGVATGVMIDVARDPFSRNLAPFEVVILCAIFAPGVAGGSAVGCWMKGRKQSGSSRITKT